MESVRSARGGAGIVSPALIVLVLLGACSSAQTERSALPTAASVAPEPSVPTATPSPAPASPDEALTLEDGLLADWNAGDGPAGLARYDERAIVELHLDADVDPIPYETIGRAIAERAAAGFTMTRTGPVVAQGRYAALPIRWTDAHGAGDGVVVLEETANHLILSQVVIGVRPSSPAATASASGQDLVSRLNDAVAAFNDRDTGPLGGLFSQDAVFHFSWEASGQGWGSQWQTVSGLSNIAAFLQQAQFSVTPGGDAIRQGPLLIYPVGITLGGGGREFWVLELHDDRITTWWDLGGP